MEKCYEMKNIYESVKQMRRAMRNAQEYMDDDGWLLKVREH